MEESIKKAFQEAKYEPNDKLAQNIWLKIALNSKRVFYFKVISFSSISLVSLISLVPMFKTLITDFTQSGFYEYLSVAFSNGGIFSSYWKDLTFSILESLPAMSVIFILTLVFIFFLSLRYLMKQFIINKYIGPSYVNA
jgi:hypothetical protein